MAQRSDLSRLDAWARFTIHFAVHAAAGGMRVPALLAPWIERACYHAAQRGPAALGIDAEGARLVRRWRERERRRERKQERKAKHRQQEAA